MRHIAKANVPLIWAIKWVDYSDTNQGFGYQLSDGSYGVLFKNETKMMLLADGQWVRLFYHLPPQLPFFIPSSLLHSVFAFGFLLPGSIMLPWHFDIYVFCTIEKSQKYLILTPIMILLNCLKNILSFFLVSVYEFQRSSTDFSRHVFKDGFFSSCRFRAGAWSSIYHIFNRLFVNFQNSNSMT